MSKTLLVAVCLSCSIVSSVHASPCTDAIALRFEKNQRQCLLLMHEGYDNLKKARVCREYHYMMDTVNFRNYLKSLETNGACYNYINNLMIAGNLFVHKLRREAKEIKI